MIGKLLIVAGAAALYYSSKSEPEYNPYNDVVFSQTILGVLGYPIDIDGNWATLEAFLMVPDDSGTTYYDALLASVDVIPAVDPASAGDWATLFAAVGFEAEEAGTLPAGSVEELLATNYAEAEAEAEA